jgi:hypothetical protein
MNVGIVGSGQVELEFGAGAHRPQRLRQAPSGVVRRAVLRIAFGTCPSLRDGRVTSVALASGALPMRSRFSTDPDGMR